MKLQTTDIATVLILATFIFDLSSAYVPRYQKPTTTPKPEDKDLYTSEHNRPTEIKYIDDPYSDFEFFNPRVPVPDLDSMFKRQGPHAFARVVKKRYHPLRSFMIAKWANVTPLPAKCGGTSGNSSEAKNCTESGTVSSEKTAAPQVEKRMPGPLLGDTTKISSFRRPYDVPQIGHNAKNAVCSKGDQWNADGVVSPLNDSVIHDK